MRPWMACLAALATASASPAQTVTLDEGVFQLSRNGQTVGSETFVIQRSGTGDDASIIARGRIVYSDGSQRMRSSLQLQGTPPVPTAYELVVEGEHAQRILARSAGRRFSVRTISTTGERMREFLVRANGLVVDDPVVHHHFFLARRSDDGSVTILAPRAGTQSAAAIEDRGMETVTLGGTDIQARHLAVRPDDGPVRHLWTDERGRILRLTIPGRDFVAERESPPG